MCEIFWVHAGIVEWISAFKFDFSSEYWPRIKKYGTNSFRITVFTEILSVQVVPVVELIVVDVITENTTCPSTLFRPRSASLRYRKAELSAPDTVNFVLFDSFLTSR